MTSDVHHEFAGVATVDVVYFGQDGWIEFAASPSGGVTATAWHWLTSGICAGPTAVVAPDGNGFGRWEIPLLGAAVTLSGRS